MKKSIVAHILDTLREQINISPQKSSFRFKLEKENYEEDLNKIRGHNLIVKELYDELIEISTSNLEIKDGYLSIDGLKFVPQKNGF